MPSPLRPAVFFSIPYLVFFAILLGVEGATRLALPHLSSLDLFVTAPEQHAQFVDSRKVRIFQGDPLLFWKLQPNLRQVLWELTLVTTNPQGMRYGQPVRAKPPGTFRILCLGDSVTFGFRLPRVFAQRPHDYNPDWLPYPALMEKRLRAANPARPIEVIPLAVPGYSSHQGLAWLRRDIGWLKPDVVTACFGWNDIGLRRRSDGEAMKTDGLSVAARRLVSSSQALAHAWRWVQTKRGSRTRVGAGSAGSVRVPTHEFVANLREIARLTRGQGAAVVVIGPIYRDRVSYPDEAERVARYRGALRAAVQEAGIAYLEIPELTEAGFPGNESLFVEHIHPNHKGHRLLAGSLLDFLAARGMLPGLSVTEPQGVSEASAGVLK